MSGFSVTAEPPTKTNSKTLPRDWSWTLTPKNKQEASKVVNFLQAPFFLFLSLYWAQEQKSIDKPRKSSGVGIKLHHLQSAHLGNGFLHWMISIPKVHKTLITPIYKGENWAWEKMKDYPQTAPIRIRNLEQYWNKMSINASHTCNTFSSIHIKSKKEKLNSI